MTTATPDFRARLQSALGAGYRLDRELGGGMSRVFVAHDVRLGRDVVVKVLPPEFAEGVSAERFEREVRFAARLQHPNIVPVLIAGTTDGLPYYMMPFVRGESLRHWLDNGFPDTRAAVRAIGDVARALVSAHGEGVIHRDIKPENILIADGIAVVTDFGIGKALDVARTHHPDASDGSLTQLGLALGTPAYMAPEQAAGDPHCDHRADLYSWGVVAYECLAGAHPFAGKRTSQAYIAAHMTERPVALSARNPSLAKSLVAIVTQCLAKDPDDRPQSAREIVDALDSALSSDSMRPAVGADTGEAIRDDPSIAVLPFVNLSADPENEYFSDGITEEIRNLLAQDHTLRVAARTSSFAFKGKPTDLRTIADYLHVGALLEGSIRRAGNRVRITAQLVNAADGYQLWSDRYDRELTDIFAVQDEIAKAIASTLRRALHGAVSETRPRNAESAPAAQRSRQLVVVPAAYDEYLKGRALIHRRGHNDGDVRSAMAHFRRALELDPGFAPALAGLAESYLWLCIFFVIPPTEAFAHVRRYTREALAIDSDLADAHYMMGEIAFWHEWDVRQCEEHLRRALAFDPSSPEALMLSARLHLVRGQRLEMHEAMEAAVRADPLGLGTRWNYIVLLCLAGAFDRAVAEADRLLTEAPFFDDARRWRGRARCMLGDVAGGLEDLKGTAAGSQPHAWLLGELAVAFGANGYHEDAARIRDDLVERSQHGWVPPTAVALAQLGAGNTDAAFQWFERAFQTRDFLCALLPFEPMFGLQMPGPHRSIIQDPRWIDLIRRVGMGT